MENPIKLDDLGGKPTIFGNIHIFNIKFQNDQRNPKFKQFGIFNSPTHQQDPHPKGVHSLKTSHPFRWNVFCKKYTWKPFQKVFTGKTQVFFQGKKVHVSFEK